MHKQCKKNAKPIPKNAQNTQEQVTKGCLGMQKTHLSTKRTQKNAQTMQKRHKKAQTMQQKRTKNAKQMQSNNAINKCNRMFWSLPLHFLLCICFFLVAFFFFCIFVRFLQKAQKSHKQHTKYETLQKLAHKAHTHRKTSHKKGGVKFGCACAFLCVLFAFVLRFLNCCFAFCLFFLGGVSFCIFCFLYALFLTSCLFHAFFLHFLVIISECGFAFFRFFYESLRFQRL